jgi:RNA polymerase sigma-70 factor (ECF subfamily)
MNAETDRYYVERCLDGHPEDFRHLVERYERALLAGIRVRRARADTVEEVAQEALVRAFENLGSLQKPESFFAWLLGIAYHVAQEIAGRERRERGRLAQYAHEPAVAGPAAGWSGDAALEAAIASLPDVFREVVLLRFYGGYSCAEVAQLLGVPLGTVTKRLSRAYQELREALDPAPST